METWQLARSSMEVEITSMGTSPTFSMEDSIATVEYSTESSTETVEDSTEASTR